MHSTISTNSKQVLVWALMFTLVLSVFPTAIADEDADEYFDYIVEDVSDDDDDGLDDTIEIWYDPDTTCGCNITVEVDIDIYDEDGDYVDYVYADHTIYGNEEEYFMQDWTPDYSGTFDFYVSMYDEWGNYEDSWNVTDIELEPMSGSSDETINVDNGVFNEDDDSLMNDIAFWAHVKEDGEDYVNITVWKKNAIGQWDYYDDGSTDDGGFLTFKNATGGEYLWDAYHDGSHLSKEGGYAVVDNTYTTGHVGVLQDWDNADDWDDFVVQIPEGNGTSDDGYVEIYDDSDNLVDSGQTDESEGDDWYAFVSYDLEQGNYTHYIYEEEDGDLLQNGSFYSYGSTSTNYDEWFEDWTYETEDTNGDGVANSIITKYDPNTECNCTVDIEVDFSVYNNDTGDYNGGDYYEHEIYSTEIDSFETDEWSPTKDGNYTFEFYLYDEDWNYEDSFNFTVYLECDDDNNNSDCDNDEWFEDSDYDSVDTDGDNLPDTIDISYNPDTECDCEIEVEVEVSVYENSTGDYVDYEYAYHTIDGTEEEYFEQSWTSHESQSYDFYVEMYDEDWNFEDEFWIHNVYLYETSGAGGPGDDDEYFDWIYDYVWDDDDDGYNDTIGWDYDPDTTCECNISVTLVVDIFDNATGDWVNYTSHNYTIYHDDDDYWWHDWSPEYNGTFDFYVELYDEDDNLEDEVEYLGVELHTRSNDDGDDDEWFYDWDYYVDPSDTINIGYDPDTDCECEMEIHVEIAIWESDTGDYVDYISANHTIYNGYSDWFTQDWTSSNDDYYDFNVSLYDEDWNLEDGFWIYDVYLSSDGGGGNGTGDDNGIGHLSDIADWEEDDGYINDYIGAVTEGEDWRYEAYFEIYDENESLVDAGQPDDNGIFVSENLDEGNYYHYIYYDEGAEDAIHYGIFYSYGESSGEDSGVINVDMAVLEDSNYDGDPNVFCDEGPCDDAFFKAHEGNWDNGISDVAIEIYEYDSGTGDMEWYETVYTNDTGEATSYDNPCGEYVWDAIYSDDEIDKGYYQVWAGCDGTGGGDDDYDEWFSYWDSDVDPSDTIHIGYDPDTECDCYVDVEVYIHVFDSDTGDHVDSLSDDHTIYSGEEDWFVQDWTAYYDGTYDFHVVLYDQEYDHDEDNFWIEDVYLSSDGGGGGDDNGVGHFGVIDDLEEDDYVNDYIGAVLEGDYYKEDSYFEIYDEEGNLVDSGNPNYYEALFVSYNLTEGWYHQDVYYEEDGALLQTGPFYSYGNSSNPETSDIVNVENFVVDDDEYAVYDDVGFIAHRGNFSDETGEEGVEITVYVWNEEEEAWYDHAYLETDDNGEAWLYNETCGQYEWESSASGEKGYYEVWAGCDGTGGGGDYDEWFYNWDYDVDQTNIKIGYDPDTECDCYVDVEVYIDVFDNDTGDHVDSLYDDHTIYNEEEDWFVQDWTAYYDGTYDFYVYMYDQEYGHDEDEFWIYDVYLSSDGGGGEDYDEWFQNWDYYGTEDDEWNKLIIGYDPDTECDCSVDVEVYIDVFDSETGDHIDNIYDSYAVSNGEGDWFEQYWTADYAGKYDFYVELYDPEYGHHEDSFEFTLIMSDEWFIDEFYQEAATVYIDLDPQTDYEGEILTHYYLDVFRLDEKEDWEWIDQEVIYDIYITGSNDNEDIHFEWTAEEDGTYRFQTWMEDEYWNGEDWANFEIDLVLNQAPEIKDLNVPWNAEFGYYYLYEGQMFDFKVDAFDEDDDDLEYTWDMGTGSMLEGESVRTGYQDDGFYIIKVSVSDGEFTTTKEFEIEVQNLAPTFEVSFNDVANEGSEVGFVVQVDDVSSDEVTVTWAFADGSNQTGTFVEYLFNEDGEYLIVVVAVDEDGGRTEKQILMTINNVAPIIIECTVNGYDCDDLLTGEATLDVEEETAVDFKLSATDPGADNITYTFNFGDGTAIMVSPDGEMSHKFADGDVFTIVVCAQDDDDDESCKTFTLPIGLLEQLEESGLPGFGLLGALSALGVIGMLRRRTH